MVYPISVHWKVEAPRLLYTEEQELKGRAYQEQLCETEIHPSHRYYLVSR